MGQLVFSFTNRKMLLQKNSRILLVDDEPDIILVMKLVLEENGFKVDSFTDASEALENFRLVYTTLL